MALWLAVFGVSLPTTPDLVHPHHSPSFVCRTVRHVLIKAPSCIPVKSCLGKGGEGDASPLTALMYLLKHTFLHFANPRSATRAGACG